MKKADVHQIENWIRQIDTYKIKGVGTTRLALSPEEMQARIYIQNEMKRIGLEVTVDGVGNICGCLLGTDSSLASVWTGSHIDTVLEAGMFDGVAGVVAGMEALRLIQQSGEPHRRNLCVRIYTAEESTRFQMGCLGSRAMAGHLTKKDLSKVHDMNGNSLEILLRDYGFCVDEFDRIPVQKGKVYAAVELHIEQSSHLERKQKTIGIVDAICAPSNLIITIQGQQSHAGGTSMEERNDAFMAAAEIALALEECSKNGLSAYTTGTVGYVDVNPNAVNVIPGRVVMSIDVRDCDFDSKTYVMDQFMNMVNEIKIRRGVSILIEEKSNDVPMKCDHRIIDILEEKCKSQNLNYMHTVSGAYHDSLFIGEFAPVGMIFVPSRDGISHSPAEWTDFEDIAVGTDLLAETLLELSR